MDPLLAKFAPKPSTVTLSAQDWWASDWARLPGQLRERDPAHRWPLDLQIAGPLAPLQTQLEAKGWRVQPQADWMRVINLLDDSVPQAEQPVLPATLDTLAETLLMRRDGDADRVEVLRLWRAPAVLDDGTELWIGTSQSMLYTRPFSAFGLWQPQPDAHGVHRGLRGVLEAFPSREDVHPQSGVPTLRVRTADGSLVVDDVDQP